MATTKKSKGNDEMVTTSKKKVNTVNTVMPAGMKLVTPVEGEPSWFKPYDGAIVYGRLIGMFSRTIGEGSYFQIKIMQPVKAIRGRGDESKVIEIQKGEIINVDERSALKGLETLAQSDGVFNVWIHCLEKVPIKGGKTFWRMEVAQECLRPPSKPVEAKPVEVDYDYDDIPF